jgi:uncharacterized protein (DUF2141 family)
MPKVRNRESHHHRIGSGRPGLRHTPAGDGDLPYKCQLGRREQRGARVESVATQLDRGQLATRIAIGFQHDENKNGKLDTNVVGMPIEDYCASRDARGTFSAPSFDDAKFEYKGGKLRMTAQLK